MRIWPMQPSIHNLILYRAYHAINSDLDMDQSAALVVQVYITCVHGVYNICLDLVLIIMIIRILQVAMVACRW